jgi:hypothetical protein
MGQSRAYTLNSGDACLRCVNKSPKILRLTGLKIYANERALLPSARIRFSMTTGRGLAGNRWRVGGAEDQPVSVESALARRLGEQRQ